jgi:hypothetical protein
MAVKLRKTKRDIVRKQVFDLFAAQDLPWDDIDKAALNHAIEEEGMTAEQIVAAFRAEHEEDEPEVIDTDNKCPDCGSELVRNGICDNEKCPENSTVAICYNHKIAESQGWILADTGAGLEIQRLDDPTTDGVRFGDDSAAFQFVKIQAERGDINAQNALKAIADSMTTWAVQQTKEATSNTEEDRELKRKYKLKVDRQKIALKYPDYTTLVWSECDTNEQDLIVALFNNHAFSLGPRRESEMPGENRLWCEVIIHHPVFLEEDHPLACWDAVLERTKRGVLKISGNEGPGGHGQYHTVYFPKDVIVSVKAYVGR